MLMSDLLETNLYAKRYSFLTDQYILERVTKCFNNKRLDLVFNFLLEYKINISDVPGLYKLLNRRKLQFIKNLNSRMYSTIIAQCISINFIPPWLIEFLNNNKERFIKILLKSMIGNPHQQDQFDFSLPLFMSLNLGWPELNIIYKSHQHSKLTSD